LLNVKVFADPVALLWFGLCGISCVLLARRQWRWAWLALGCVVAGCVAEAVRFPGQLLARLERPYLRQTGAPIEPADAVAVLGGYLESSSNSILGLQFNDAVDRIMTGIALVRQGKGSVLVLSGGARRIPPGTRVLAQAGATKDWIRSWDLVPVPIEVLDWCWDTHEEALRLRNLTRKNGWKRIILVTSAWHMKRSVAAFRKAGIEVVPVACDFRGTFSLSGARLLPFVPCTESLVLLDLWAEETLGYAYYRLRSWA
jgi:uncharacterized SAM-binding protein YcdF (DUF218 family)